MHLVVRMHQATAQACCCCAVPQFRDCLCGVQVVPHVALALGAGNIAMLGWVRILRVLRAARLLRTMPGVGVLIEVGTGSFL